MNPNTVSIHIINPDLIPPDEHASCLSDEEISRAAAFRFPADARRWACFRGATRKILSTRTRTTPHQVPIVLTDHGKPVLAHPFDHLHFSLSHCNDLGLLAISTVGPIGIDVEPRIRASELLDCESTFCHPDEIGKLPIKHISRCRELMNIWIAKEALLKALGTGFIHPPESVRLKPEASSHLMTAETQHAGASDQRIHQLEHPLLTAHRAALSAPSRVNRIEILASEESTNPPPSEKVPPRSTNPDG